MKTCPKCGKEYPNSENFCIDCGSKLEAAERHEEAHSGLRVEIERLSAQMAQLKKEFEGRHEEVSGAASTGLSKLTGRLGTLEKRIYKQPEPAANEKLVSVISSVGELEKRMDELEKSVSEVRVPESLEAKIAQLEKQVARAGKEALRVAKAKHMPDSEAMGIVSDMGELEQRLDDVEIKLGEIPEPEELDLSPMEKRINALEKKTDSIKSGLKSFVSVLKDNESTLANLESKAHTFAKHSDIAELSKSIAAENEKITASAGDLVSLRKKTEGAIARAENTVKSSIASETARMRAWIRRSESKFATKEQTDSIVSELSKSIAAENERIEAKLGELSSLKKDMEKSVARMERSAKSSIGSDERRLREWMGRAESSFATREMVNRRIMQSEAALSKQLEQMKSKTDDSAASSIGAIESLKSKMDSDMASLNESTLATLESRMHGSANKSDLAELRKAMSAEDEKIALKLEELSSLKKDMEKSVARMEKSVKSSISSDERRLREWMGRAESSFATREQMDSMMPELDARITEKLKPIENFREKVMVIAGLAIEQQEKFKQLKSGTTEMVNRRIMQSETALSKQLEQMKSKTDNSAASSIGAIESLKSKMDSDMASLNESISRLEEFENRIGGELEALKGSSASRHDIEAIKELAESYNARLSTFKQMLASHSMTLGELSQARAQMQSEQEHAIDNMNSRISEAVQGVRTQGNSIVADMEKKMNDSISAGLRSIEETRSRMEGEMKLVLDTLSRSQGFDKAVQSELAALKAEVGELDGRIKAAVSEEKGALDNAIKSELKKLQKTSRDAEQKLGLLKDSWDKAIKDTVRKSVDEFEEVRKSYSESLEKAKNIEGYVNSLVDKAMKEVNKKTGEESRMNASLRKDLESALKETRITNKDSQEKLAMVKEFITNIESRFGSEIDGLNRRMDKLAKIQQKLELEGISPGRKAR